VIALIAPSLPLAAVRVAGVPAAGRADRGHQQQADAQHHGDRAVAPDSQSDQRRADQQLGRWGTLQSEHAKHGRSFRTSLPSDGCMRPR
jgi:hypothetical protein